MAREFNERLGLSGIVLTRIDGSSHAGAALSMRMIAGVPLGFLGTGEKVDELEEFHADRIAGRDSGGGEMWFLWWGVRWRRWIVKRGTKWLPG